MQIQQSQVWQEAMTEQVRDHRLRTYSVPRNVRSSEVSETTLVEKLLAGCALLAATGFIGTVIVGTIAACLQ